MRADSWSLPVFRNARFLALILVAVAIAALLVKGVWNSRGNEGEESAVSNSGRPGDHSSRRTEKGGQEGTFRGVVEQSAPELLGVTREIEKAMRTESSLGSFLKDEGNPDRFYLATQVAVSRASETGDYGPLLWIANFSEEGFEQVSFQVPGITSKLGVVHDLEQKMLLAESASGHKADLFKEKIVTASGREMVRSLDSNAINAVDPGYIAGLISGASRENPTAAMELAGLIHDPGVREDAKVHALKGYLQRDEQGAIQYIENLAPSQARDKMILELIKKRISQGLDGGLEEWTGEIGSSEIAGKARALLTKRR